MRISKVQKVKTIFCEPDNKPKFRRHFRKQLEVTKKN